MYYLYFIVFFIILLFLAVLFINFTVNTDMNLDKKVTKLEISVVVFLSIFLFFGIKKWENVQKYYDTKIYISLFFLLMISYIDIKRKYIPDILNFAFYIMGITYLTDISKLDDIIKNSMFLTFPALFLYLYGEKLFKSEAIGAGDIKLIMGIGILFYQIDFFDIYIYYFVAYISALPFVIYILITKTGEKHIAFAPFLLIAYLYIYCYKGGFN